MTRAIRNVLRCASACAVALACSHFAGAQVIDATEDDEGPIIIGQRRAYERFYFERPAVGLNFTNIYQRDVNETATGKTTARQYLFEQTLDVATRGYVLSPNFITLDLAAAGGINENWIDIRSSSPAGSDSESDSSIGTIYEWDVSGTYQPNGPSPLTLYSRRQQSWVFREFGGAIETIDTDTGAALDIRARTLPTHLSVSHLESEQSGLEEFDDFSYTRDAFNWHSTWLPAVNQRVNWDYAFTRVEQQGVIDQEYQTHDARLAHELTFGQRDRHSLTSSLNYYNQSGDSDLERFRWDERLRFRHTDDLRTRFDYTYDRFSVNDNDRSRHRASAGFTHHLFDSLTTEGNAGVQYVESGGAETWETFADIAWSYRKQVPLGLFSANLGLSWSRQDSDANQQTIFAIDQPAAFADPLPIVITGTNINPSSIVITDPSGLILYQPGVDFTVTQFPDRVEINRVIGGSIAPGQTVLLDYQLAPLPAAVTSSNAITVGARYDFREGPLRGLTLYSSYARVNQDIDTDQPSAFVLNEYTDVIYGLEYRIWNLILGAERQEHDSTINPFDADRFFARYNQAVGPRTLLSFNASYTSIEYFEPVNELDLFTVSAQLSHRFSPRLFGTATVLYRYETDDLRGRTTGFEQQLELRWRHRQTQVFVLVRNANLDNPDQDQSFQFAQLGLRREF